MPDTEECILQASIYIKFKNKSDVTSRGQGVIWSQGVEGTNYCVQEKLNDALYIVRNLVNIF